MQTNRPQYPIHHALLVRPTLTPVTISAHAEHRSCTRFPYLAHASSFRRHRLLVNAARTAPSFGEHVITDQRFARCELPTGEPMVLVVADRRHLDEGFVVITVLREHEAMACGTWRSVP